jgi:hypothetical protein
MIGRASAFLDILNAAVPRMMQVLRVRRAALADAEPLLAPLKMKRMPLFITGDFSQQVLIRLY